MHIQGVSPTVSPLTAYTYVYTYTYAYTYAYTGGVADRLSAYFVGSGFVTGYAAGARNELVVMDLQVVLM